MDLMAAKMTAVNLWRRISPKLRMVTFAAAAALCLFVIGGMESKFFQADGHKPLDCKNTSAWIAENDKRIASLNAIIAANSTSDEAKRAWLELVIIKDLNAVWSEKCRPRQARRAD